MREGLPWIWRILPPDKLFTAFTSEKSSYEIMWITVVRSHMVRSGPAGGWIKRYADTHQGYEKDMGS